MHDLLQVQPLEGLLAAQGLIAREIIVSADALADDAALVGAVVDFVNDLHQRVFLTPGEYPQEASWSYSADYYFAQVINGGHGQYASNSRMRSRGLRDCRLGLQAMGASEYLAIFDAFLAIMAAGGPRAHGIQEGAGFGQKDPEIEALDQALFALQSLTATNAAWLRTLPNVRSLPQAELEPAYEALRAANPQFQARKDAAEARRAAFQQEDPTLRAAHACCAQEGATFKELTAGTPIGPNGSIGVDWGAISSAGFRWLRVIYGSYAEWRDGERALKGIYFYATSSAYPQPAGDGTVRAAIIARAQNGSCSPADLAQFYTRPLIEFTSLMARSMQARAALPTLQRYRCANRSLRDLLRRRWPRR